MDTLPSASAIEKALFKQLDSKEEIWLTTQLRQITDPPSGRNLYLTYSLIGRKISSDPVADSDLTLSPGIKGGSSCQISRRELARIYLLSVVLNSDPDYFVPRVAKLIQISDTVELITLLRYLNILPRCEQFLDTAVEALRTNIVTVFDAIALDNPYPRHHFNEQQWNQMYLKAAFLDRDLFRIQGVDERANGTLARIISDYAHERWAASRKVDPLIWRPLTRFLDDSLLKDIKHLLSSEDSREQKAGYLICEKSKKNEAMKLIENHPLDKVYKKDPFDWKDLIN